MSLLTKPYYIYIITFSIPFVVYCLQWSTLYPPLQDELLLFYAFSFAFCLIQAIVFPLNSKKHKYHNIPDSKNNVKVLIGLYVFYIIDVIYSGYVPFLAFTQGVDYGGSINYGLPVVHVIAVTFNLFYALYTFHQYVSNRAKLNLIIYILLLFPFVILLQRSNIMYIVIGSLYLYVISLRTVLKRNVVYTLCMILASLYAFGYLGNLRSGNGDSKFIPQASGVTTEFLSGPVPNEFYWSYLYIGSPLANLQYNISTAKDKTSDFEGFVVNEVLPDFLAKRLNQELSIKPRAFNQINPFLNVGTIYARPYNYLGWTGMILIFIIFICLMTSYANVVSHSYTYGVSGLAVMCVVIVLSNFENSISFSAYSFPLIYPIVLSGIKNYRNKKKKLAIR